MKRRNKNKISQNVTRMVLSLFNEELLLSGRISDLIPDNHATHTTNNSIKFNGGLIKWLQKNLTCNLISLIIFC